MVDESFARKSQKYQIGEYYWIKTKHGWEVCKAVSYDREVVFEMMGVEGNVYTIKDIEASFSVVFQENEWYGIWNLDAEKWMCDTDGMIVFYPAYALAAGAALNIRDMFSVVPAKFADDGKPIIYENTQN